MDFRNWIGLFLMGSINNLPYVIVNSAASTIADGFNHKNLVGVVFGANVAFSVVVKSLNAFLLLQVPYTTRYIVNGCVMLLGLFGIAYAFNFGFAIFCIAIVGATSAFGENVTLGFLSWFPGPMVNAWSSGTGMAGLLGASLYIIFGCAVGQGSGEDDELRKLTKYAFLLTTPVVIIYWLAYFVIIKRPERAPSSISVPGPGEAGNEDSGNNKDENEESIGQETTTIQDDKAAILDRREEALCRKVARCLKTVLWLGLNLGAVYVFEYVVRGCAAKVRPKDEYHKGCPELYAALQLCYQAGVFVSRSSVQMFRIRRVEVLSILQFINMALWIIDVHYKFMPVAILPALMIYVGLLGGASYVNIFYSLLHDDIYHQEDREMCVNLAGLFINAGIVLGTGVETLLFETVLSSD